MSRFLSACRWNLCIQSRHRLLHAAAVIVIVWIAVLRRLPPDSAAMIVPVVIFAELSIIGFFFLAAQLLFERSQAVLQALIVSRLTDAHYILSRCASLALVALAGSVAVGVFSPGTVRNFPLLVAGSVLTALLYELIAIIIVVRYRSINDFIAIALLWFLPLNLPLLTYFGLYDTGLSWLVPTHASLVLLRGAYEPLSGTTVAIATAYLVLAIAGAYLWALRAYRKHVVFHGGL